MTKPAYELTYTKEAKIRLSAGNTKIGKLYNFNLLPGSAPLQNKTKGLLTTIEGTCTGCCTECENGGCYAINSAKRYHNTTIPSWGMNTLIMRNDLSGMFKQLKTELVKKKVTLLRYHSAGEIPNYEYLIKMVELAKELPDVTFYVYTKRFDYISKYMSENIEFPNNLVINISRWHDNTKNYNFDSLNTFAYDDGTDPELEKWVHCPAVDKRGKETGITCDKCGRCYKANRTKTAVYAH